MRLINLLEIVLERPMVHSMQQQQQQQRSELCSLLPDSLGHNALGVLHIG